MNNEYIQNYTNPKFPYQRDFTERLARTIATEMTINNGIARWGNGSLVPMTCAEFAKYLGYPVDLTRQDVALKEQAKKSDLNCKQRLAQVKPSLTCSQASA